MKRNLWAVLLLLSASNLMAEVRPVALSAMADGKLIALDADNSLMITDRKSNFVQLCAVPRRYSVVDLAANGRLDENLIFVTVRGTDILLSPILQFTPQGSQVRHWLIPASFASGIALDYTNRVLYISTPKDASIYSLDLRKTGAQPVYLMQVAGAMRLGALAIDISGQRLFAADPFSGKVYAVAPATRQSSLFAEGLGEPAALAIGQAANRLYVADRVQRCVWAIRLDQGPHNPQRFWSSNNLHEPLGLAVDTSGTVWIGDQLAKAVFGVAASGQVTTLH
jgi:hypothetical protein